MRNNKRVKCIIIVFCIIGTIWLLSNRTNNVFEEMYYSECFSIIKGGVTKTSLASVKNCYRADRDEEEMMYGGTTIVYDVTILKDKSIRVEVEKNGQIVIKVGINSADNMMTIHYKYKLKEQKLYVKYFFEDSKTYEEIANLEEVLPQFLAEQGIEATTLEEVSDIMLEDFLRQWFEGNSMSKFSMEDLGDFEIVYE